MRRLLLVLTVLSLPVLGATCDSLLSLQLPDAAIDTAQVVAAGTFAMPAGAGQPNGGPNFKGLPEFCRVAATLKPSGDSDIKIEVWLPNPAAWNGKYLGVGNGGRAGVISYGATGAPLGRGYAVASTDTGHAGTGADGTFAFGHPERWWISRGAPYMK